VLIPAPDKEFENSAIICPKGIFEPHDVDCGRSSISFMYFFFQEIKDEIKGI
jgi:hypothetical protein